MDILNQKLSEEEIIKVSKLFADAFSEDPFVQAIYVGNGDFENLIKIAIKYCNDLGEVHLAMKSTKIIGAALWLPSKVPFLSITNVIKKRMIKDILKFIINSSTKTTINIFTVSSNFSTNHLKDVNHYYLFALASDINHRNIGVGRALMNFAEEKFGTNEVYYLENSNENNLNFYTSLGYKIISSKTIKGATVFYMIKNYK